MVRITLKNIFILSALIILAITVTLWSPDGFHQIYAQNSNILHSDNISCQNAEKILLSKDRKFEQLQWISQDETERKNFLSTLTSDQINTILDCSKNMLPELKSDVITKKIGFFQGMNNHPAKGRAQIIEIENVPYLRLENFEIGLTPYKHSETIPDLHVYLTKDNNFSNKIYLEKLKTKLGNKNYSLKQIDHYSDYNKVIIYDELSKEIFSEIPLSNPRFLIDNISELFNNQIKINAPKIESKIIYEKTGILKGSPGFQSTGLIDTSAEEDEAQLKSSNIKISNGFDFHLYATKDGNVNKPSDWTFGPDGFIYISNTNTNEILRYSSVDGKFKDTFVSANDNGGLKGPKDLVFSPDGNYLYISSFLTNEILRYDGHTGMFLNKFVGAYYGGTLQRPMKMIFDNNGTYLYVSSADNNHVLKFNTITGKLDQIIGNSDVDNTQLANPSGITLDDNGFIYISNTNTNEILRYSSVDGKFKDTFVSANDNGGLKGPKDLVFSPDGNYLYISSFLTNEILRYDGHTGMFLNKFVGAYNGNILNPKYMIYGPDGNFYVSSIDTDQILRFDKTGNFIDVFVERNYGGLKSPKGLIFGPHGDLFVSNGDDNNVLRFDTSGIFKGEFVKRSNSSLMKPEGLVFTPNCYDTTIEGCYLLVSSSENNLVFSYPYNDADISTSNEFVITEEDEIKNPQSIIFGPDGNLYVSSFDTDEIIRFNGNEKFTSPIKFLDVFASSGGLDGPGGLLFDNKTSNLFVSSTNNNQIFKYDQKTGDFLGVLVPQNYTIMHSPQALLSGPNDDLYVISSATNEILKYDIINGNLKEKLVTDKSGGLYQPKDLGFDKDGNLCANNIITNNIHCYDVKTGQSVRKLNVSFNSGLLGIPNSEFGPDGELYVSNELTDDISRFDRNTNLFSSEFLRGGQELLQGPRSLVFGPDDNLYVATNNNKIVRLDGETGQYIDDFIGYASGGLSAPQSLAFHKEFLYVSSYDNNKVLRYNQETGKFVDNFIKSHSRELITPKGILFDDKGNLYVSSSRNNKILVYDDVTGEFKKELPNNGKLLDPVGLTFGNNGKLLVSSSGNNQILSYDLTSGNGPEVLVSDEFLDDPQDLIFDSKDNTLYISNSKSNLILAYNFDTKEITEIKELAKQVNVVKPYGLTILNRDLFISNLDANQILKYNIEDKKAVELNSDSVGVTKPLGLSFGPDKNLYVISGKTHEIFRYDGNTGDILDKISFKKLYDENNYGLPDGQLRNLVFSPDGNYLYISSFFTNEILRYDLATKQLESFLDQSNGLQNPEKLIFGPDESLYISSSGKNPIFVYDMISKNLTTISSPTAYPTLDIINMKFAHNGELYITANDYNEVFHVDPNTENFSEFDPGGIYLGELDSDTLRTKYLLNGINTAKYNTLVVYDQLLERPVSTILLQDRLSFNFLPLPVLWNALISNVESVSEPVFESKQIKNKAGYFQGLNDIPAIGQVKLAHTQDTAVITLENFEVRYDKNHYASFEGAGITKGPRITVCLVNGATFTGSELACENKPNLVRQMGPLMLNVGDQTYSVNYPDLNRFDTILLYDNLLKKDFVEVKLRDTEFLRLSPQLFLDWAQYQFPTFPLLLLGFIAFPLTFDYVRTIFKVTFLSMHFLKKPKNLPKTSTNKKITIMIPAHNEQAGIKASIEAALKTKYKNKEIIVIDDGSTDNTYKIAKEFSEKGLIKLLHRTKASGSKAAALNYGFVYSTGDLILCMDGDTLLDENSLDNAVSYFEKEDVRAVSGNVEILSGDEGIVNTLTNAQTYEYMIAIELGRSFTSVFNILLVISGAFGIFRRDVFRRLGKFDKDTLTEDFDLTLKVRKTKGKIPFVRDSIARTYCPNNWRTWIKQRQRWAHGQMRTLIKHRDLMLSSQFTNRDRIAMFDMLVLDIIMNFLFVIYLIALVPASIIMAVYGNIHIMINVLTLIFIVYLISETVIFVSAILMSHRYKYFKYIYLVPFMAFFYRPFLKIIIFKSYINAARNKKASWG